MFKYPSGGYECDPKCPISDADAETYESGAKNPVYLHLKKHGFDVDKYLKDEAMGNFWFCFIFIICFFFFT